MKKTAIVLLSLLLLLSLFAACAQKNDTASPGNITPSSQPTLHVSTGEEDVSVKFSEFLCTNLWLDTATMHCCSLNEDGTYSWLDSKKNPDEISSGTWRITRDDQNFLTLYLTDGASGSTLILHEIELYDESIYGVDDDGNAIVWLITQRS